MHKLSTVIPRLVLGLVFAGFIFTVPVCTADELPVIRPIYTPFKGVLFIPNDGKPHPGVLLLHGSEGGLYSITKLRAQALAAQGYAAFAFCYAGCRSGSEADVYRPNRETIDVDLERTRDALTWLANSEFVGGRKVGVYGVSRGAEQALLLASLLARDDQAVQPAAVAVHAPSDVVVGGWNWYWRDPVCGQAGGSWNALCGSEPPQDDAHWPVAWLWRSDPGLVVPDRRIEVERIGAPIFITHGDQDQVWSVDRTSRIKKALEDAGRHPEVHIFPGEGHEFSPEADYRRTVCLLSFLKSTLM